MLTIHMTVRNNAIDHLLKNDLEPRKHGVTRPPQGPERPFPVRDRGPAAPPTYAGSVTVFDPAAEQSAAGQSAAGTTTHARTAAFFDLDKTIIAKSSTLAFSKPFFAQGLLNRRAVLKSSYAQFIYLLSGADHDQMDRMRAHMTNMCTGWDVEQVKSIVNETLHDIVTPLVFAEAADLIAAHKLCGRDVVVVSASGEEIVAPIARALGATHAMATRMVVEDGRYTGEIAFYCYGEGKVQAIRELAAREGYPLEHCYAYSDSITDLPMLESVGHPSVVNPDRGLRREALERGWPVMSFSRPVSLRDRIPAPSGAAIATTAAVGISALAAGAVTYSLLRRYAF
ncbi:HAD-superfamily protein subfamily protein IB hydrolase [Mycobacterium intracellulare subsp. chimaera]|uniref:HAD-superfamily protein subfamily protein IB hydrolase n=1 Tax=Mycobacterium intracellulare subsp. chimaera TaxID=222805 RepID=A0A7U5RTK7_MYCIT|nr:HAD-superfamily protein subfamily protein IB hydrolase [Mycobacterium intracellulare subsp. chimaera]